MRNRILCVILLVYAVIACGCDGSTSADTVQIESVYLNSEKISLHVSADKWFLGGGGTTHYLTKKSYEEAVAEIKSNEIECFLVKDYNFFRLPQTRGVYYWRVRQLTGEKKWQCEVALSDMNCSFYGQGPSRRVPFPYFLVVDDLNPGLNVGTEYPVNRETFEVLVGQLGMYDQIRVESDRYHLTFRGSTLHILLQDDHLTVLSIE